MPLSPAFDRIATETRAVTETADIAAGRLSTAQIAANFVDAHPPLTPHEAVVEASRCYFCYDAPCMEACPTGIDIPGFIRKIATDNLRGSALRILEQNIFGGSCARVCPTEILCEAACVRMAEEERPVRIGALQRRATDWLMEHDPQPFVRGPATGKRVAVVGAGPAGLACAHRLALHGHEVTVFEARPKPGGLNEYGIAAYKVTDNFAQREVDFILSVGGISIEYDKRLGRDISVASLRAEYDAVFLGIGLDGVRALGIAGEAVGGVLDAVDFIAVLRQTEDKSTMAIGRRVVVIGGGNTAIDAATQARLLGAEEVTMVYRRGPADMSATLDEQDWAQTNGVRIRHWATPHALHGAGGHVRAVEFMRTVPDATGRAVATGETFLLEADMVLKAVGQVFIADKLSHPALTVTDGRIAVDEDRQTSVPGVYAGGDCIVGVDLTVAAVQDGKLAAEAINRQLRG